MSISIALLLGLAAVAANLAFLKYWKAVERKESSAGRIPARKLVGDRKSSMLYLEDFAFYRRGDRYALSVMDFAVTFVLATGGLPPIPALLICGVGGVAWCLASHIILLLKGGNEPGSPYPGRMWVSRVGLVHLPYHGAQYILGFVGLALVYEMIRGIIPWSPVVIVGLGAGCAYFLIGRDAYNNKEG